MARPGNRATGCCTNPVGAERRPFEVEYALQGLKQPVGVADWETQIVRALPDDLKTRLPSVEELEAELATVAEDENEHH